MTTPDAYAAYTARRAAMVEQWLAVPANAATVGTPTPARYRLDQNLDDLYKHHCPGSPDYTGPVTP